ncbi:MAG: hypothetical protein EP338_09440 [Bacteroidetes bacterium]|nr:MAG: hypothetical protein EP338_09440 [Bacteroidota bacterium]
MTKFSLVLAFTLSTLAIVHGQSTNDSITIHVYRPYAFLGSLAPIKIKINDQIYRVWNNRSYRIRMANTDLNITTKSLFRKKVLLQQSETPSDLYINCKQIVTFRLGPEFNLEEEGSALPKIEKIEKRHPKITK